MDETPVVTVFLRHGTDVLLLGRSDAVGSYPGLWGGVAGHVAPDSGANATDIEATHDPDAAAEREIREETGIQDAALVRRGESFVVTDPDHGRWLVHPFLYDAPSREVEPNAETAEWAWVQPPAILARETVPDLWRSYRAVAPTVETVAADREHGSAHLSLRALEVLRDRAAALAAGVEDAGDPAADLAALARSLRAARPDMAAVANRVNRAMTRATAQATSADGFGPSAVREAASRVLAGAVDADDRAARAAADLAADARVFTLSRSGTVEAALTRGSPASVLLPVSDPGGEGRGVAERLAAAGLDVTLTSDAAAPGLLADCDLVLVGADAIQPDGAVVNKVGTYPAALAAARGDVPVHVVCARDKIASDPVTDFESTDAEEVYDGPAGVTVESPVFEVTPADLVTGVVTEDGVLDGDDVRAVAAEHRAWADWSTDRSNE